MTLHLIKLSVGSASLADLAAWQTGHGAAHPPLRHRTRMMPKRAAELIGGGSIFWVVAGVVSARQRLLDIRAAAREDGTPCTDLVLDAALVPVRPRPMRPFQGWRYLTPADAPADACGIEEAGLPDALRRELALLCLL